MRYLLSWHQLCHRQALADLLIRKERRGIDEFARAVILGSNADLCSLTEAQRWRTEATISRIAQRAALVSHELPRSPSDKDGELAA